MKYKIHKKADDIKDAVIEKTGHKIHFTMREVESTREQNRKTKEEIDAKVRIEKAKMKNIEKNHPFVKEMSEKDRNTVYMYYEAQQFVTMGEEKLKEFEENDKELQEELIEIGKQIKEFAPKTTDLNE